MSNLGLPVPPGFTITTQACVHFFDNEEQWPDNLWAEALEGLKHVEAITGKRFGDAENPLLVSVRSGAPVSMPGMMDTVLNLGLNDITVEAWPPRAETRASPGTPTGASSPCSAMWFWASTTPDLRG